MKYTDEDIKNFMKDFIDNATYGKGYIEIEPSSYDDRFSEDTIAEVFNQFKDSEYKEESFFSDALYEKALDVFWEYESYEEHYVLEQLDSAISGKGEEFEEAFNDYLERNNYEKDRDFLYAHGLDGISYDIEAFMPELKLNLLLTTDEETNLDCSSIHDMMYDYENGIDDKEPLDNALSYLITQQGYDVDTVMKAYKNEKKTGNKFVDSVVNELYNHTYTMGVTTVLCRIGGKEALELLDAIAKGKGSITFPKESMLGIYNSWLGSGSMLDIELDKDFTVPTKMVHETQIEGIRRGDRRYCYTVDETYGLVGSAWVEGVSVDLENDKMLDIKLKPDSPTKDDIKR